MKNKILLASIILLVLGVFAVYADLSVSTSNSISRGHNTTTLTIVNPSSSDFTIDGISVAPFTDLLGKPLQFIVTDGGSSVDSVLANVTATNFPVEDDSNLGTKDASVIITYSNDTNNYSQTVNFPVVFGWCSDGDLGNVSISSVTDTTSDSDWKWMPLDKVDIDVKVKNNDKDNDLDVLVMMDLYDTVDNQFLGLDGNGGDVEDTITVDSKTTETLTLTAIVPTAALKDSSRYVLYVKAAEDGNEEEQCAEQTKDIDVTRDTNRIALSDIKTPSIIACGDTATLDLGVSNIGNKDEKKVQVTVRNAELGLLQSKIINNLGKDSDTKQLSFSFAIPQNATAKDYTISVDTDYKYDSNSGDYAITDDNSATATIKVAGNCQVTPTNSLTLSTSLESAANAGQEITVKTTLTNTGSAQATYSLAVSGQDSWSTGLRLSSSSVTLNAGESKDVLIYLTPNKGVSGDNSFTITAVSGSTTKTQNVVVSVAKSAGFSLGNNWYLWLIIGINVILIVVIVIVAISVSRK